MIFFAGLLGICCAACSEPTPFGSELLEDQTADYTATDTLTLQFSLEREDSVITSDRASITDYFLCGRMVDPVFGVSESQVYTLMQLSELSPNWKDSRLDSIVMFLRLNSSGVYGDTLQPHTLRVERLEEKLDNSSAYYSNSRLNVGAEIGRLSDFYPQPNTDLVLFDTAGNKAPYLRILLDKGFGEEIFNWDSLTLADDSVFYERLRGLRLTVSNASDPGAILAIDLNDIGFSFVRMYYTQGDTATRTFDLYFRGTNKFASYTHDYSGTPVEPLIGKPLDQMLYLQGMTGLKVKMHIPYVNSLGNVAINRAELQLTVAQPAGDPASLTPADQLVLTYMDTDSTLSYTSDVTFALELGSSLNGLLDFGGYPYEYMSNGTTVKRYSMTMSSFFQNMVEDTTSAGLSRSVFLNVYTQNRSAMRSILLGPADQTYRPRLEVKYTRIN